MRRAPVSITTNIAEGFERASQKRVSALFEHSKGSAARPEACFVALETGYFKQGNHEKINFVSAR